MHFLCYFQPKEKCNTAKTGRFRQFRRIQHTNRNIQFCSAKYCVAGALLDFQIQYSSSNNKWHSCRDAQQMSPSQPRPFHIRLNVCETYTDAFNPILLRIQWLIIHMQNTNHNIRRSECIFAHASLGTALVEDFLAYSEDSSFSSQRDRLWIGEKLFTNHLLRTKADTSSFRTRTEQTYTSAWCEEWNERSYWMLLLFSFLFAQFTDTIWCIVFSMVVVSFYAHWFWNRIRSFRCARETALDWRTKLYHRKRSKKKKQ